MRHSTYIRVAGMLVITSLTPASADNYHQSAKNTSMLKTQSSPVIIPRTPITSLVPPATEPRLGVEKGPIDRLKELFPGWPHQATITPPVDKPFASNTDRVYYLHELKYRTARHTSPDALVYIKKGFDPAKPIILLIHNHGLSNNVVQEFTGKKIQEQMEEGPPNSVYVMPEWALDPASSTMDSGPFNRPGFFKNMLVEIFSKIEPLQSATIDNISEIYVSTFAGGFRAAASEISRNGLQDKVKGITLLDSQRSDDSMDTWLKANLNDLQQGRKYFHNIFFSPADSEKAKAQVRQIENMLASSRLSSAFIMKDYRNADKILPASALARHGIVFKYNSSTAFSSGDLQERYIQASMKALKMRNTGTKLAGYYNQL